MTTLPESQRLFTALLLKGKKSLLYPGIWEHYAELFYRKVRTRDMGGDSKTHEFTNAVLHKMEQI
jgi:isocitrate dehydrogenase (NAD+)